ncbi:ibr domain containing protein [Stylonychia lemnae]|uniref:Ibr domain containing protein n=1 Tax=Stylonychia lemnae TaxID=5949 RepID=A0A078AG49_STYLE|nr:ibr domain containing protein [Stylonychia lemnae]|eukprot:CDW81199.1 ibr domain containing protein [Stylonychia lemnae]
MDSKLCDICYSTEIEPDNQPRINTLPCQCIPQNYCDQCLESWVVSSVQKNYMPEISIKCMSNKCKSIFTLEQIVDFICQKSKPMDLSQINEVALNHYLNNQQDVKQCPKQGCKYYGVINYKKCRENLVCELCQTEWRDEIHISYTEKFLSQIKNLMHLNFDFFTALRNLIFEEPCPRCGVLIQKNGGCNHMMCGKCSHEFCWWCLDGYYGYNHSQNLFCPFRQTALIGSLVIAFLMINFKLVYWSDILMGIEWFIVYNLGALVCEVVFFVSFMSYAQLHDNYLRYRRERSQYLYQGDRITRNATKLNLLIWILMTVIALLFQGFIFMNVSKSVFIYRWFELTFFEICLALFGGFIYLTSKGVVFIGRLFKYIYQRYVRRNQNYQFDGRKICNPYQKCGDCLTN